MTTKQFLSRVRRLGPWSFVEGRVFMWSPELQMVSYDPRRIGADEGKLALLHEVGHALLGHGPRRRGVDHQIAEIEAWNVARKVARAIGVPVDESYVRRRLNSQTRPAPLHVRTQPAKAPACRRPARRRHGD
jgi:hypothetical protein